MQISEPETRRGEQITSACSEIRHLLTQREPRRLFPSVSAFGNEVPEEMAARRHEMSYQGQPS